MRILIFLVALNLFLNAYSGTVTKIVLNSYNTLNKNFKTITNDKIVELSKMSDNYSGTKEVKKYIGTLNLSKSEREDIYLRIAIYQNKIDRNEAEIMFKNLNGKDGFDSTLSKVIGNNPQGTSGHLNELRIANQAVESGFEVVAIGKKFNDGIKKSDTDIDVLLTKNSKEILIEAKKYSSTTKMDLIKFRGDLDTLVIYGDKISKVKSIKIFSFTEKPQSEQLLNQYQFWADKKGVQLIFGTPNEQIEQIKMLEMIL